MADYYEILGVARDASTGDIEIVSHSRVEGGIRYEQANDGWFSWLNFFGTSKVPHLEENVAAAEITLSDDEFETLAAAGAQ